MMARKKSKLLKRIGRWLIYLLIFFCVASTFAVFLFKYVNPPITPLMIIRYQQQRKQDGKAFMHKEWKSLNDISPNLSRAVIASEDNLFPKHNGFDRIAIANAIEHNKNSDQKLGASTISQQTAKNVFLWPSRTFVRKGLEVYFTVLIEMIWGKQRIMEVYLNIIETGKGMYGAEMAARTYFGVSAKQLTAAQAALIAASLPSPLKSNPGNPSAYLLMREDQILYLMPRVIGLDVK